MVVFASGCLSKSAPSSWHTERAKMTKREMYDASKRVWSQLPEVQAKLLAEKQKSQAKTNRLRMKLYQEVTISICSYVH